MMRWHRLCAILVGVLLLYIVITGTGIQLADMRALVFHAPDTDPDMLMMRQHIHGTPNFAVVSAPDYTAVPFPDGFDFPAAILKASTLGRAAAPGADLRLVEVRTAQGQVEGHVQMGAQHLIFDLGTGSALPPEFLPTGDPPRDFHSTRSSFKYFHRFNYLGQIGTALNTLGAIAFFIMIFTGLSHYLRLYRARAAKLGKRSLLWSAGDWWRNLHRWTAVIAGVLVIWATVTGFVLSLDNVGAFVSTIGSHGPPPGPSAFDADFSSPLTDAELTPMTRSTLTAFQHDMPGTAVKVLRLRYFAGYPQGVVIAADPDTSQLVFNATTGARMSMTEKGYPKVAFPAGWEWHQRLKRIHRGDIFGMPGRWLDTLGALAMLYLSVSGVVMYFQLWRRRKRAGSGALIWR
jgi:uncharacterized iron-regulated membrane protein